MIAIILVNYNGWKDTIECLESLMRLEGDDWKIIVVDNHSSDYSVERIKKWADNSEKANQSSSVWRNLPKERLREPCVCVLDEGEVNSTSPHSLITVVKSSVNAGFAAANNIGINLAMRDLKCSHIWLLNNDTIVDKRSGSELLNKSRENFGKSIIGSSIFYYSNPEIIQGLGVNYNIMIARGYQISHLCSRSDIKDVNDVERRMTYVMGASMFIPRSFIEQIGLMNERYFLYFEEMDWAIRAKGRYKMAYAPDAIVYHKEGGSIGTSTLGRASNDSIFYFSRALLLFYAFHYPLLIPTALARLGFNFARYAIKRDWEGCHAILAAVGVVAKGYVTGKIAGPIERKS